MTGNSIKSKKYILLDWRKETNSIHCLVKSIIGFYSTLSALVRFSTEIPFLSIYRIQYLWETGLMIHWIRTNSPSMNVDRCLAKSKDSARQKPIKLVDLTSAFFILGIGTGVAMIRFLYELIYFHFYQRRLRSNNY